MTIGLIYSAPFDAVAVSAAQDVFELLAPSDAAVIIHSIYLGQTSDKGDAQAEGLKVQIWRGWTTSGSGGSTVTPVPLHTGFPAAGTVIEINNTTVATTSGVVVFQDIFDINIGWQFRPTPEERIVVSPGQRLSVRLPAPADSLTMSGNIIFAELGG
jgi:hypothetical protein